MSWLVVCNTNQCTIYQYDKKNKPLIFIKELLHPEAKLKGIDLTSDKPGQYKTRSFTRGSYSPDETPKEMEIERFAQEIAHTLDADRKENAYQHLFIITPPKMHGLIQQHLTESVKALVAQFINKDYTHLTEQEIVQEFQKSQLLI